MSVCCLPFTCCLHYHPLFNLSIFFLLSLFSSPFDFYFPKCVFISTFSQFNLSSYTFPNLAFVIFPPVSFSVCVWSLPFSVSVFPSMYGIYIFPSHFSLCQCSSNLTRVCSGRPSLFSPLHSILCTSPALFYLFPLFPRPIAPVVSFRIAVCLVFTFYIYTVCFPHFILTSSSSILFSFHFAFLLYFSPFSMLSSFVVSSSPPMSIILYCPFLFPSHTWCLNPLSLSLPFQFPLTFSSQLIRPLKAFVGATLTPYTVSPSPSPSLPSATLAFPSLPLRTVNDLSFLISHGTFLS